MGLGERIFGRRRVLDAWAPVPALALVLGLTSGLRAATWTVCAVGCNDTSIQVAYTGAASGDTIEVEGNVQENDSFNRGINITVTSNNGSIWNGAAGSTSPTLSFQNGNGAVVNIDNITMENTSTAGGYVIYYQNNTTYIDMDGVTLDRDSTSTTNNAIIYIAAGDNTDIFDIQQSSLVGDGDDYGLYFGSGNDEAALIENSLLYGFTGGSYAAIYTSRNNTWGGVSIINDTFFNNEYGYFDAGTSANSGSGTAYKNNLFVGDVNDFSLPADLSAGNLATMEATIEYNGFGTQTPNAAYGPGNIYGLTAAEEFVNPLTGIGTTPNLHEIAGAPSICAATGAGAPAVDKDGNPRPTGACYDIGAYQYTGAAASATPSPTASPTPTVTQSSTAGPAGSPTASPTATPSPTPSASPTQAAFVSPTPTPPPLVLTPHYPNPNPAGGAGSWLPYTINAPATVTIRIYDIAGELVRAWAPIAQPAGTYECYWNLLNSSGEKTASGVFLVQIDASSPAGDGTNQEAWEKCAVAR